MQSITSSQNPRYKELKALITQAKARREAGRTVLEGVHLAQSYLDAQLTPKLCVVSESGLDNAEVAAIVERCDDLQVEYLMVTDRQFGSLSVVRNGIGIMLVIDTPQPSDSSSLSSDALLLDGVQDPGNLGTILRTSAAAGVSEIYCSANTASAWAPKVLRAGMGAHFGLTIHENVDLSELISTATVPVLATTLQASASIYEADLTRPVAWIVGNEGQGVDESLLKDNVTQVNIPQAPNVESLNVSAATAVCLFEQVRQRRAAG